MTQSPVKRSKTILVVDDIPLMRTILSKYLKSLGLKILTEDGVSCGVDVIEAANGKLALECLKKRPVDMIFLDLMMPEMDGLTFLACKREDPQMNAIPVIVCSALGQKETVDRAQELGASSYIVKPFTVKSVEEKLREALCTLEKQGSASRQAPSLSL